MSTADNQTKRICNFVGVKDLNDETSATLSGGFVQLSEHVYRGVPYGRRLTVKSAVRDLGRYGFSSIVSHVHVVPVLENLRGWMLYTQPNFQGIPYFVGSGAWEDLSQGSKRILFNDKIRSLRPISSF